MVTWAAFHDADPALAELAEGRLDRDGLVAVGTLRANGWPRISPVEPLIVEGRLCLGMMWQSRKALDLRRDPRCVVHSTVHDKTGTEGDVKIYGRAEEIEDPGGREQYCRALERRIGWRPDGDFHLFTVDVTEVAYFAVEGSGHEVRTWRAP